MSQSRRSVELIAIRTEKKNDDAIAKKAKVGKFMPVKSNPYCDRITVKALEVKARGHEITKIHEEFTKTANIYEGCGIGII